MGSLKVRSAQLPPPSPRHAFSLIQKDDVGEERGGFDRGLKKSHSFFRSFRIKSRTNSNKNSAHENDNADSCSYNHPFIPKSSSVGGGFFRTRSCREPKSSNSSYVSFNQNLDYVTKPYGSFTISRLDNRRFFPPHGKNVGIEKGENAATFSTFFRPNGTEGNGPGSNFLWQQRSLSDGNLTTVINTKSGCGKVNGKNKGDSNCCDDAKIPDNSNARKEYEKPPLSIKSVPPSVPPLPVPEPPTCDVSFPSSQCYNAKKYTQARKEIGCEKNYPSSTILGTERKPKERENEIIDDRSCCEVESTVTEPWDPPSMNASSKKVPKFFRSISLRSLLPIGGMNKSRPSGGQAKRVAPPTVPLVSFPSFRGKKGTISAKVSSEDFSSSASNTSLDKTQQQLLLYSGNSLGSTASSPESSSASSSSACGSDNRSSIGTDDGFFVAPGEFRTHANPYLEELEEYNPITQGIYVKQSRSVDSFPNSKANGRAFNQKFIEMHQAQYGINVNNAGLNLEQSNGSLMKGSGINMDETSMGSGVGQLVTVQVDPHPHPHPSLKCTTNQTIPNNNMTGSTNVYDHSHHHNHYPHHPHHLHNHHVTHHQPQNLHGAHQYTNNMTQQQSATHSKSQPLPQQPGQSNAHGPNQPMVSHYQTQVSLEDQGIDLTQSPGRESPSSTASSNTGSGSGSGSGVGSVGSGSNGCRHSTSSFDSGRASSTIYQQGVRYSGLSSESSSGSFRHSYHSSSSSLGSIPPEEICNFDVAAMLAQGIPDHEVLNAWLTGIHFECYYQNFVQAGYDMNTISRMTPEDLNAIGVTKPHHRKKLKSEISQLNISDGMPEYIPGSLDEWLNLLKLEEYFAKLKAQGYNDVRQVTNITWEDLEDIGILKLGHQKKFMLAIKRVEDILAGKRITSVTTPNAYLTPLMQHRTIGNLQYGNSSYGTNGLNYSQNGSHNSPSFPHRGIGTQQHQMQQTLWRQTSAPGGGPVGKYGPSSQTSSSSPVPASTTAAVHQYHPEVISIQVNGGRRRSLETPADSEPIYGTSSFLPQSSRRPSDDGEITPTNEFSSVPIYPCQPGNKTSTLPRLLKNKPIAKVLGSIQPSEVGNGVPNGGYTSNGILKSHHKAENNQLIMNHVQQGYGDGFKSLPRDLRRFANKGQAAQQAQQKQQQAQQQPIRIFGASNGNIGDNSGYEGTDVRRCMPPAPPLRGCSDGDGSSGSLNSGESWAVLPPPPPALSCDVQFSSCSENSLDDLPLPPPPADDLNHANNSNVQCGIASSGGAHPASNTTSSQIYSQQITKSSYCHSIGYLYNATGGDGAGSNIRNTSPKSRDPSPVGSDFSETEYVSGGNYNSGGNACNATTFPRGVRRNGSDASFKSNSSTESESIPFANDNAGTIKQQKNGRSQSHSGVLNVSNQERTEDTQGSTGDLLSDIGNMLADLTDELDAILEQEMNSKR